MAGDRNRVDNNDGSRDEPRNRTDDERGIGLNDMRGSASRTGKRDDEDTPDIGDTDGIRPSTGG